MRGGIGNGRRFDDVMKLWVMMGGKSRLMGWFNYYMILMNTLRLRCSHVHRDALLVGAPILFYRLITHCSALSSSHSPIQSLLDCGLHLTSYVVTREWKGTFCIAGPASY